MRINVFNSIRVLCTVATIVSANLILATNVSLAMTCDDVFRPAAEVEVLELGSFAGTIENPEAWMKERIAQQRPLRFEEAIRFGLSIMPPGPERLSLQRTVLEEVVRSGAEVNNTSLGSIVRTDNFRSPGRFFYRYPRVQWIMRPLRDSDDFLSAVTRALQLATMSKVKRVYFKSLRASKPSQQIEELALIATDAILWKAKVASAEIFNEGWRPPGRDYREAIGRALSTVFFGVAFERSLNSISILQVSPELWQMAKVGDASAISTHLRKHYGARAYLRWYARYMALAVTATAVTVAVLIGPEVAMTAVSQYRIEHTLTDLDSSDPTTGEAVRLARKSSDDLDRELRIRAAELRSLNLVSPREREFAEKLLSDLK